LKEILWKFFLLFEMKTKFSHYGQRKDSTTKVRQQRKRMRDAWIDNRPPGVKGRPGVVTPLEKEFILKQIREEHGIGNHPTISNLVKMTFFFLLVNFLVNYALCFSPSRQKTFRI
jgi:hypothetical protein